MRDGAAPPRPRRGKEASEPSERVFQREVVRLARERGWHVFHVADSRRSTGSGFPDLVLRRGDALLVAELKRGYRRVTEDQAAWLRAFAASGVTACVWRPSQMAEIVAALD